MENSMEGKDKDENDKQGCVLRSMITLFKEIPPVIKTIILLTTGAGNTDIKKLIDADRASFVRYCYELVERLERLTKLIETRVEQVEDTFADEMRIQMEGALPCPFCGSSGVTGVVISAIDNTYYFVMCASGDCGARTKLESAPFKAVRHWNRRYCSNAMSLN